MGAAGRLAYLFIDGVLTAVFGAGTAAVLTGFVVVCYVMTLEPAVDFRTRRGWGDAVRLGVRCGFTFIFPHELLPFIGVFCSGGWLGRLV